MSIEKEKVEEREKSGYLDSGRRRVYDPKEAILIFDTFVLSFVGDGFQKEINETNGDFSFRSTLSIIRIIVIASINAFN